ncbi:MAG: hypothetical protein IV086_10340 [Hyphomonadaceae bacterium]|nr:hypothetical protein [Hyphomonadaceae bacterium]
MNSYRLRAVLLAVEEGETGPPRLSIREAVQAEFEGFLEVATGGGGWAITAKGREWLSADRKRSGGPVWMRYTKAAVVLVGV